MSSSRVYVNFIRIFLDQARARHYSNNEFYRKYYSFAWKHYFLIIFEKLFLFSRSRSKSSIYTLIFLIWNGQKYNILANNERVNVYENKCLLTASSSHFHKNWHTLIQLFYYYFRVGIIVFKVKKFSFHLYLFFLAWNEHILAILEKNKCVRNLMSAYHQLYMGLANQKAPIA